MSMKRMLLTVGAAIALFAPATDTSAQYRRYDRIFDRQRYDRPIATSPVRAPRADAIAIRTTAAAVKKPVAQTTHKPAPAVPLSAEQLAAKAAVDELFAREPALAAAKEKPDPKLAREAAAKHSAQEKKLAALQAKEAAAAAKRKESAEKIKAREDTKAAPSKAKQQAPAKGKMTNAAVSRTKADGTRPASAVAAAPARPVLRMPTP
jgi:hypothetical protein